MDVAVSHTLTEVPYIHYHYLESPSECREREKKLFKQLWLFKCQSPGIRSGRRDVKNTARTLERYLCKSAEMKENKKRTGKRKDKHDEATRENVNHHKMKMGKVEDEKSRPGRCV